MYLLSSLEALSLGGSRGSTDGSCWALAMVGRTVSLVHHCQLRFPVPEVGLYFRHQLLAHHTRLMGPCRFPTLLWIIVGPDGEPLLGHHLSELRT